MKGFSRGTGYTKPRPWKQILSLQMRLSTVFHAERPCLVLPAPLVLEFPLFSGWVSSSKWTRRSCHMSTSWGLGCFRETLWYEAGEYSAWSCLLPGPQFKGPWCAHRRPCSPSWQACRPARSQHICSPCLRGQGFACESVAYQHLGGGQHHSHPKTRGCSTDLS